MRHRTPCEEHQSNFWYLQKCSALVVVVAELCSKSRGLQRRASFVQYLIYTHALRGVLFPVVWLSIYVSTTDPFKYAVGVEVCLWFGSCIGPSIQP